MQMAKGSPFDTSSRLYVEASSRLMRDNPVVIDHIDLAQGIPSLPRAPQSAGRLIFFWWRDVPIGMAEIPPALLPMRSAVLREIVLDKSAVAVGSWLFEEDFRPPLRGEGSPVVEPGPGILGGLEHPLQRLEERVRKFEEASSKHSVSLVICTRERPDDLRRCLASITTLDREADEVIVVDNAPRTDRTRGVVESFSGTEVRYVLEMRPGLSAARNAGIRASSGDIVAFTDDDVEVHPKFLRRLCAPFEDPAVMAVTGNVFPVELETEAQRLFQWNYGGLGFGFRPMTYDADFMKRTQWKGTPAWYIGMGANMAFRREVFARIGGFDERLGAGTSGCSEDSEMWYRILASAWKCRYEPTAVAYHRHRRSGEELRSQLYAYMRGHVAALFVQHERHGHRGNLRRAFITLPSYWGRWGLRRLLGRGGGPIFLATQVRGGAAGIVYYLRHRRHPSAPRCDFRS